MWRWSFYLHLCIIMSSCKNKMYVQSRYFYALTRALFWCLYPEVRSSCRNKHQNHARVINSSLLQSIHSFMYNQENLTPITCYFSPRGILCNKLFFCISLGGYTEKCCYLWSMAGSCGRCAVFMKTSWHWSAFHITVPLRGINGSLSHFHHKGPNNAKLLVFFVVSLRTTLIIQSNCQWCQSSWWPCDVTLTNRCLTQPVITMLHKFIDYWFGYCDIHTIQCRLGYVKSE